MLARIDRALCPFFGLVFFLCACLVAASIFLREIGAAQSWIDPAVRYVVLWCALLGLWANGGLGQDPHITAEMLISRAGPKLRRVLEVVRYLVAVGFMAILGYVSWNLVAAELRTDIREQSILSLPYAYLHLVIPIAASLYVLVTLARLRLAWLGRDR